MLSLLLPSPPLRPSDMIYTFNEILTVLLFGPNDMIVAEQDIR